MAQTVTISRSKTGTVPAYSGWEKITFDWTTDSDGRASDIVSMVGQIHEVITIPDADDFPTADYDIQLQDAVNSDIDFLRGQGVDRSSDAVEFIEPLVSSVTPVVVAGKVKFLVYNAGDSKSGQAILLLKT